MGTVLFDSLIASLKTMVFRLCPVSPRGDAEFLFETVLEVVSGVEAAFHRDLGNGIVGGEEHLLSLAETNETHIFAEGLSRDQLEFL